ncbi:MAG: hypothetical protein IJ190_04990 [Prevotella sp.]|nr:hypothetical protein [Prevotella sp.]
MTTTCHAQVSDDDKHRLRQDSLRSDYEEWLRNEPLRSVPRDSQVISPMESHFSAINPLEQIPEHSKVNINIITPALKTDMRLAYQSHWLEEQRKEQQGGAMMIGVNPLSLIGYVLSKILPHRKSKKEREREKLKQILDNY